MAYTSKPDIEEPTWDIAYLFPFQGGWSEDEYLSLPTNRLVEFSHGYLEVLPMPTESHQLIVAYLYSQLLAFLKRLRPGAIVLFAPLRIRLWAGKYREPDLAVMLAEHADRRHEQYWETPDLVVEVVSREYRRHDLETKRREYARGGIQEYWIVDPDEKIVTVLTLREKHYRVHGTFGPDAIIDSALLGGFEVPAGEIWAAANL